MDVDLKRRKVFVTLLVSALEIWTLLQYNLLTLLRDFIFLIFRTETDILDAIALVTPAGGIISHELVFCDTIGRSSI